jgi:hypothetical protein
MAGVSSTVLRNTPSLHVKGLIKAAVVVTAVGVVLTICGSLKGYRGIERLGEIMAFGGYVVFLVARIKFARSSRRSLENGDQSLET